MESRQEIKAFIRVFLCAICGDHCHMLSAFLPLLTPSWVVWASAVRAEKKHFTVTVCAICCLKVCEYKPKHADCHVFCILVYIRNTSTRAV